MTDIAGGNNHLTAVIIKQQHLRGQNHIAIQSGIGRSWFALAARQSPKIRQPGASRQSSTAGTSTTAPSRQAGAAQGFSLRAAVRGALRNRQSPG